MEAQNKMSFQEQSANNATWLPSQFSLQVLNYLFKFPLFISIALQNSGDLFMTRQRSRARNAMKKLRLHQAVNKKIKIKLKKQSL
jgi:hypothetical protein